MIQHTQRRTRHTILALAGALILTAFTFVSPTASHAATKFIVVQHNVEKKGAVLRKALEKAHGDKAQALTLQEVCQSDLPVIADYLSGIGEKWTVNSQQSRTNGCGTGDDVLTLVIRTAQGATASTHALSPDEKENDNGARVHQRQQKLVCVGWGSGPAKVVCSVHVALGQAYVVATDTNAQRTQLKEIKDITKKFIGDGALVVVGGDFNAQPKDKDLNRMYAKGVDADGGAPNGQFFEATQLTNQSADRGGKNTSFPTNGTPRKIDYVFYSSNKTAWSQSGATMELFATGSDHRMLVTSAKVG